MRQRLSMGFFGRRHAGQAEIEHLDVPIAPDHDVLGLDVPMHDPVRVCGGERAGDLAADVDDGVERQAGLCAQARAKRLAVDQFLHHVVPAIVCLPDFVDRDDVGMVERGRRTRLAQEPFDGRNRFAALPQHLQGDRAVERRVERAIHLAHAAASEQPVNPVLGDL